jgi:hypothetical protein
VRHLLEEIPAAQPSAQNVDDGRRSLFAGEDVANLGSAPLEASDLAFPINLATALRLADARLLIVTAAQASAWVAEAQLQRAKVIAIPELDVGLVYYRHDGFGPDFNRGVNNPVFGLPGGGGPLNQNLNAMWIGGSFYAVFPVTDAIFQPLAARQVLNSRRFDIQTAKNDALLEKSDVYFTVHQYRRQYAGAIDVVARGRLLLARIEELSRDLVPRIEVARAANLLATLGQRATAARQRRSLSREP